MSQSPPFLLSCHTTYAPPAPSGQAQPDCSLATVQTGTPSESQPAAGEPKGGRRWAKMFRARPPSPASDQATTTPPCSSEQPPTKSRSLASTRPISKNGAGG